MAVSYDKLPMLFQTILDVPMYEGIGTLGHDIARPPAVALDHTMTLTGPPTWAAWPLSNLPILSFNPVTPDFMELAAVESTDLDFIAGAWSGMIWVFMDVLDTRYLMCKGLANTDGWYWYVDANGAIHAVTNQAAAQQDTFGGNGEVTISTWWCLGMSRLGADIALYKNGNLLAVTAAAHINPLTAVARKFLVGIDSTELANMWDGYLWRPIVASSQLSQLEHWKYFEMTRDLFGV